MNNHHLISYNNKGDQSYLCHTENFLKKYDPFSILMENYSLFSMLTSKAQTLTSSSTFNIQKYFTNKKNALSFVQDEASGNNSWKGLMFLWVVVAGKMDQ